MRRVCIALTALCLVLTLTAGFSGCGLFRVLRGSGNTVEQRFDFTGFTNVSAGWAFDVSISQGASYSINVTVDDNLQNYLDVARNGDTLKISLRDGYIYNNLHLKAAVSMPRLSGLTLSGASKGNASGFNLADDFVLNVSGASQATLTNMGVNKLTLDISGASRASGSVNASGNAVLQASGASTIELSGKAVDADIESSGASTVNLSDFLVRDAHFEVSGASNATVSATGTLSGNVSGASRLYYTGTPVLGNIHTSGASSVSKK
jgi:hypothetical protein